MSEAKNLARIILRADGSVHIAFRDIRAVCATAANLAALFSDPLDFIETQSFQYTPKLPWLRSGGSRAAQVYFR